MKDQSLSILHCVIFRFAVVQCKSILIFIPDTVTSKAAHLVSIVYVSKQKLFDYDRNKSYLWVYPVISIGNNGDCVHGNIWCLDIRLEKTMQVLILEFKWAG